MVNLTIVATRGERIIRWKCVDLRELHERTQLFLSLGYAVS